MSACRQCVSFIAVLSTALSEDVHADAGLLCNAAVLVSVVRERRRSVGLANELDTSFFAFVTLYSCTFTFSFLATWKHYEHMHWIVYQGCEALEGIELA